MSSSSYDQMRSTAAGMDSDLSRTGADIAAKVSDAATKAQREVGAQLNHQMDRLSTSIQQKPLQSAAIAAGVGFLFAVLARR